MSPMTEPVQIGTKPQVKSEPVITLTEKAADEVRRIMAEQQASGTQDKLYLRMRVVGGGSTGFQHKLELDPQFNTNQDEEFTIRGISVVIDKRSQLYLNGETVDFHDDPNRRGFSIAPSSMTNS